MSKAFTKETDDEGEPEKKDTFPANTKNYVTPEGYAALQNELRLLLKEERPKIVEAGITSCEMFIESSRRRYSSAAHTVKHARVADY